MHAASSSSRSAADRIVQPNLDAAMDGVPPLDAILDVLRGRRLVVLAGAGMSTESGIPDYRGPESVGRVRKPMTYQEFTRSEAARARYWSRSSVGWATLAAARPNAAHRALTRLEQGGLLTGVITQNVDGLHHAAGTRSVVELHGTLSAVRCLACGRVEPRDAYQSRLLAQNPRWAAELSGWIDRSLAERAPDGDVELPSWVAEDFEIPACTFCGGVMKPDVVFFGENVPAARLAEAWALFDAADALFVVGSSLTVYSGRRFIYRAQEVEMPIAIANLGATRGDAAAAAKVDARLGDVLPPLADALLAAR